MKSTGEKLTGPQEFLDRQNGNVVCAACFEHSTLGMTDNEAEAFIKANIGRRFISPQMKDTGTMLPIVMTVARNSWFHVIPTQWTCAITADECFFELP